MSKQFSLYILTILLVASMGMGLGCGQSDKEPDEENPVAGNMTELIDLTGVNVLWLVSDALRIDSLSCYGGSVSTPNLDRLAARGTLFERAYSTAPWTLPSSITLFTGRYPKQHYVGKNEEDEEQPIYYVHDEELLLGEVLQASGYELLYSLENKLAEKSNCTQGYREIEGKSRSIEPVMEYLKNGKENEPFLLLKWILDPHAPYEPEEPFFSRIDITQYNLNHPPEFYKHLTCFNHQWQYKEDGGESRKIDIQLTPDENRFLRALYDAEVQSMDERVGKILDALDASGIANNTLVIFTSDHGEEFHDHGWYNHGHSYYDEVVRIPLILAGPGIPKDIRIGTPVSHIDLQPTLADLLGVSPEPLDFQGQSLVPLVRGDASGFTDRTLFFEGGPGYALLKNGYKFYWFKDQKELFALAEDPAEKNNLASTRSDLTDQMSENLKDLKDELEQKRKQREKFLDESALQEVQNETLEQMKALGYIH